MFAPFTCGHTKMQMNSSGSYGDGGVAISHAYVKSPPFRCDIPGALGVMYDDANKLLLVPSPGKVFSWPVNSYPPPENPSTTFIKDGPVFAVRFSLDGKILAVQRSGQEIEFVNREDCTEFRQRCKSGTDRILGFFWTDCPSRDIVFVTTSGLEIYSLYLGRNGLKLVDSKRLNVSWYVYTHDSRLVLLASGMQCKDLFGYQFSAGGVVQLPRFDVIMTKSETNRKPVLAPDDVRIASMYGRLYCLQVDRAAMQLRIYRFYRDAVVSQGSMPMYSRNVAISIVDNILLVHQIDSKVVLLYDILSDPKVPISAPLPLVIRQQLSSPGAVTRPFEDARDADTQSTPGINNARPLTANEANVYGDGWVFVNPDIILDHAHGILWKIFIDLEAVAASSSDIPSLLAFLQRRRTEAEKLSLGVIRSMILEKRPLPLISNAMKVVATAYSHTTKPVNSTASFNTSAMPDASTVFHQIPASPLRSRSMVNMASTSQLSAPEVESASVAVATTSNSPPHQSTLAPANSNKDASEERDADGVWHVQNLQTLERPRKPVDTNAEESTDDENVSEGMIEDNDSAMGNGSEITFQAEGMRKSTLINAASSSTLSSESSASFQNSSIKREMDSSSLKSKVSQASSPIISPAEMHNDIFSLVQEEMMADVDFFVAVILEYLYSAAAEQLKVHSSLYVLLINLLGREERYQDLHRLIAAKILEPSKLVAEQIMEVGHNHLLAHKMGMDMLRQLHCHGEYARALLEEGRLLEGLRYVRQNKVEAIPPTAFLEKAATSKDPHTLVAVFRFCCDCVPNFQLTQYFDIYCKLINEALSIRAQ
ncbi:hypothetical protein O6H91_01G032200 [Diphasiastrum complanatum]|uniref:Uncharacterized protein n=2 Tax=Diphasiastrum complanatum TaxID=34168 RepID=A0ACC2EPK6_DIPCM|nr:hypothetical protein O6H91_01G032200 [Diphasiastrum complanatum]KAJ7568421.1 hypothetical protein O6H91_01G032200 [Diphasiastrum complanatum]